MSLRVGIIGCGAIAQRVYLPVLPRLRGVQIVAIADVDRIRLAAARRRLPRAAAYADAHALLSHEPLEAVIIATAPQSHSEHAIAAFARGLHVYVEKPLASTLTEGEAAVAAWRRAGTVGLMGFNCRFTPLNGRLRELLRAGRAGTPVCFRTSFSIAPHDVPSWKRHRDSGGGVLLDLGSHHIDLIRYLSGREVKGVHATVRSRSTEDDTALLELSLDDGSQMQSFFSLAAAEQDRVEVYGDRGRLAVSRFTSLDVEITDNPAGPAGALRALGRRAAMLSSIPRAIVARREPMRDPGYKAALTYFVAAARGATVSDARAADLLEGMECLAIVDAAERSAQTGRVVSFEHRA